MRSRSTSNGRPSHVRPLARHLLLAAAAILVACSESGGDEGQDLARGQELYQAHCASCHGGETGGEISDIPPPHNAEGHTWHHPDCQLVEITLEGLPPRTGSPGMPAFDGQLTEEEVRDVLAYVKTWWEPEQRDIQATITEEQCT